MKGKSLGWILLVGALAVPAVLFYKWWTQMKAAQGAEARQAVPAAAAPFSSGAPASGEQPPAAGSQAPDAAAAQPAPAADSAPTAPSQTPAAPTAVAQASADPAPAPAPSLESPDGSAPSPEGSAPSGEAPQGEAPQSPLVAKIEYMPKTSRDPMLSVADQRELLKQRMAAQISQQELQKAAEEPAAPPPPPPKPLCDSFDLQGIIGTGGDIAAIVNDRIVREGDPIAGAVVERLTTRTVVFRKGKKTCMKRVSK